MFSRSRAFATRNHNGNAGRDIYFRYSLEFLPFLAVAIVTSYKLKLLACRDAEATLAFLAELPGVNADSVLQRAIRLYDKFHAGTNGSSGGNSGGGGNTSVTNWVQLCVCGFGGGGAFGSGCCRSFQSFALAAHLCFL